MPRLVKVIDEERPVTLPVLTFPRAQNSRRVQGSDDWRQPSRVLYLSMRLRDPELPPQQSLSRRRSQTYNQPGLQGRNFRI